MKLDLDIRELSKKRKVQYPAKRQMNLYFKEDRTTAPATAALYILFALVIVLALSKVLVYDMWSEANRLERQANELLRQQAEYQQELSTYRELEQQYIRAAYTQKELEQTDRMEILWLIDDVLRANAQVTQISIEDNQVLVSFSGVTLRQAADLIARLESSRLVKQVNVDTAASTQADNTLVDVNVFFTVTPQTEEVTQP